MLLSMPQKRSFPEDEAQLSLDFIFGFTIFMVSFIFVATMMSGLLINLQSKTIDYDAVAYRTAVVLSEDPGEPYNWHLLDITDPAQRDRVNRTGLSIARNNPGILQEAKVDHFFRSSSGAGCSASSSFCYPSDYRQKLIFGDYPYNFNITLRKIGDPYLYSVGDIAPDRYGYIRRVVKIRQPSYLNVNVTQGISSTLKVNFSMQELYSVDPLYRADVLNADSRIYLYNFTNSTRLEYIDVCIYPPGGGVPTCIPPIGGFPTITVDGSPAPVDVINGSCVLIDAGYFRRINLDEYSMIELRLTFNETVSDDIPEPYSNAIIPPAVPAVMEVKVW
jgi:hypothetical protein